MAAAGGARSRCRRTSRCVRHLELDVELLLQGDEALVAEHGVVLARRPLTGGVAPSGRQGGIWNMRENTMLSKNAKLGQIAVSLKIENIQKYNKNSKNRICFARESEEV